MVRMSMAILAVMLWVVPGMAEVVTFDDLPPGTETDYAGGDSGGSYFGGATPTGVIVDGPWGPEIRQTFTSNGVSFVNYFEPTYGSWSGFSYSNVNDTTMAGYFNQYAAFTGSGMGPGRDNYGVAFGYDDLTANSFDDTPFDPTNPDVLWGLPSLMLPVGALISGMHVTNTTYAVLSMLTGDDFAKKFGGASGDDQDWLMLSAYGIDAEGNPLSAHVDFYLADFRFSNNDLDYIVTDWAWMNLAPLAGAASLHFNISSSDVGPNGMNTPGYFAVDNIEYEFAAASAVPEPGSLLLATFAALGAGMIRAGSRTGSRKL